MSITGLTPYSPDARASLIVNPSIRYMHRILSACLFGRGDSAGKVQTVELLYLRRMLLRTADTPNIGYHILRQITRVARSTTGTICVGGMVIRIAEALGLNYSRFRAMETYPIDIKHLLQCQMIKRIRRNPPVYSLQYHQPDHTVDDPRQWILPDPASTDISDEDNWYLTLKDGQGHVQPDSSSQTPGSSSSHSHSVSTSTGPTVEELSQRTLQMEAQMQAMQQWYAQHFPHLPPFPGATPPPAPQ